MMEGRLSSATGVMQGRLHGRDAAFHGISTDSRTVQARELFFALQGPRFDGSEFVPQAAAAGAAGAVVAGPPGTDLPTIEVADTRRALGRVAAAWRRQMPATVIALTGSNGKTTCKEMIASCLALAAPTLATRGNLNNDVGVPLMLAELAPDHRYAVLELGANHHGEIAWLASLVEPVIAMITNAGPAHLEGFGSIRGVAEAKGEILAGQPRPEWTVLNADDPYFGYWRTLAAGTEVVSFGMHAEADVRAVNVESTESGTAFTLLAGSNRGFRSTKTPVRPFPEIEVSLPLAGRHNAQLAAAAAAAVLAAGLDAETIRRGLEAVRPVAGRIKALPGIHGCRVFDDSYNANPASVTAAGQFVAARPGESWLVLGDMGELGPESANLHRQVGEALAAAGVDRLFATGPLSRHAVEAFGGDGTWAESVDALEDLLVRQLGDRGAQGVNVLVKGSRAMRMERVVRALALPANDEPGA
ncbi:MAG TPA: UDP-N-acetylmuramoyl-tripeptide--D-alanyl-D-alanine ligase [Woeseiaceae bacterium]|nr:UDP-N-acetylmuramoyl-tripeptide--D-alanyl-D-alanine ligase [Woeseiaceae bacterium]